MALRKGDRGVEVAQVRSRLAALGHLHNLDSVGLTEPEAGGATEQTEALFDSDLENAVRAFQQQRGLIADGIVGPATVSSLADTVHQLGSRDMSYLVTRPMVGDDVVNFQQRLHELGFYTGNIDGSFGALTHDAATEYQRSSGLTPDGVVGPATLASLSNLSTLVTGGNLSSIVERERARNAGPQLTGKRIVLDPGPGGSERPVSIETPYGSTTDAELLWQLTERLASLMTQAGVEVLWSRPETILPNDDERAEIANSFKADLMISLRLDRHSNPEANGTAAFYFGNSLGAVSMMGDALAGYIQREIISRTGTQDCRTHGRSWPLLRRTRMPSVQLDLGYINNEQDMANLLDKDTREQIVDAIIVGVKRLYLLGEGDQKTGTFSVEDILSYEPTNK